MVMQDNVLCWFCLVSVQLLVLFWSDLVSGWVSLGQPCSGSPPTSLIIPQFLLATSPPDLKRYIVVCP